MDTKVIHKSAGHQDESPEWVHADQVWFIPGREGRDNEGRILILLHKLSGGKSPVLFLSIDAEKVFDRVDWGFMLNTLEALGLGRMV